jgi:nitrate reductase beta subunit
MCDNYINPSKGGTRQLNHDYECDSIARPHLLKIQHLSKLHWGPNFYETLGDTFKPYQNNGKFFNIENYK